MTDGISRWRAAAMVFFLTIGVSGVFSAVPLLGEALASAVASVGFFILIPAIWLFADAVPYVDAGGGDTEPRATRQPTSGRHGVDRGTVDSRSSTRASVDGDDPIDQLRDRYARGEITQTEFESRLEKLLETEDVRADDHRSGQHHGETGGRRRHREAH